MTAVAMAHTEPGEVPEFSMRELTAVISAMPTRTATRPDTIEVEFIRHLSPTATNRLLDLVNRS